MIYHYAATILTNMVLGVVLVFALVQPGSGADYTVHVVEPAVTNHMILSDDPLPAVCKELRPIRLSACRGEYEPASFVITASKPLTAVRIEAGPLRGQGEEWPRESLDVRVVKDYYDTNVVVEGKTTMPLLLVHDESFLGIDPSPTDKEPEQMKNVARGPLRDATSLPPVNINSRKQFWVTVRVPENAQPGTYRTTIRIVPEGSASVQIPLAVTVYPFELLPSMMEYSIYYPSHLIRPGDEPQQFKELTAEQMRLELRNMLAHGVTNPNIYQGPEKRPDGSLDFAAVERILEVRESVGMRSGPLYLVIHPILFTDRHLTPEERSETHRHVREINEWARARGYQEVYFAAGDEWWGERLSAERDSMAAVDEAGGKVFVAVTTPEFYDRVGDALHRPVLMWMAIERMMMAASKKNYSPAESLRHMEELARAASFEKMRAHKGISKCIDGVHRRGRKIYTYMNPIAGLPMPEFHRRSGGLGAWRVGFDGAMTWCYVNLFGDRVDQPMWVAMAYRTENGVLDTLHWEGYREGVDDVRYLTTLLDALNRARGRFPNDPLIRSVDRWLESVDIANGDLNAIRREMARLIVALSDMGYKQLTPEQTLAGVDVQSIKAIQFPEPWRFRMDAEDLGVKEKWFDPGTDDSGWVCLRTDSGKGWGSDPGYGWYRATLPLTPQDAKSRTFKYLYFGACDEDALIYVNGRQVFEHSIESTGLLNSEIWLTPFSVPLEAVQLNGNDPISVRVYNSRGMGGVWKPVHLIISDKRLSEDQILALMQIRLQR